jgi:hypothetical protein
VAVDTQQRYSVAGLTIVPVISRLPPGAIHICTGSVGVAVVPNVTTERVIVDENTGLSSTSVSSENAQKRTMCSHFPVSPENNGRSEEIFFMYVWQVGLARHVVSQSSCM